MKKIDEQKIFRQMNVSLFFETQVIHERKNREKYNERYTKAFHAAFESLYSGNYDESSTLCKKLKRKCFMWLLYVEFIYFCNAMEKPLPSEYEFAKAFGYKEKKFKSFQLKVQNKLPCNKFVSQSYKEFSDFVAWENEYKQYSVKNIAVCATMSAGKSTFVNALLGRDVLPARNEATTAKITSVYDKDKSNRMIGFVQTVGNRISECCDDVQLAKLDEWNNSSDVLRIFMQGDLDGIRNKNMIVAVHDTPGTNNSGDRGHHDITMQFLHENMMDALIFVANAEQLCTNDERELLSELLKKVVSPKTLPVLFVLNKADAIDPEKEELSQIITSYEKYLAELGFVNVTVLPVSSKAARLLKMARNGRAERFTARESKAFAEMFDTFTELHDFSGGESTYSVDLESENRITVGSREYPLSKIRSALECTGLLQIEKYIEELF